MNAPAVAEGDVAAAFHRDLLEFNEFGKATRVETLALPGGPGRSVPVYINEFWTSRQRQAHSLHEISYRACFKPQLPAFFIRRLTRPGEIVYDPFMGRGTTPLEAALLERVPWGCDINPLSVHLLAPRLRPPSLEELRERLESLPLRGRGGVWRDLLAFYHPDVLRAITVLRRHFARPDADDTDAWLRMVMTNRLTGHSSGFLSVYTLPPNQAVSIKSQLRLNALHGRVPPLRNVRTILLRKSRQLMRHLTDAERVILRAAAARARLVTASCDSTPELPSGQVRLIVTSPPFLNEVDYRGDNWLRCWFHGIDSRRVPVWQINGLNAWREKMTGVFHELRRVLAPGGWIAFEIGEIRGGRVRLEETVLPAAMEAGLRPELVLINSQKFTKTSNCWGITNTVRGTNTNRIVLLRK